MSYLMLTFDVESCLGTDEISRALPYTLEILSHYPRIKVTFNVAAMAVLIDKMPIQSILVAGHEVAAHGYQHDMDWDSKGKEEQEELIVKAKKTLEANLDTEIVGWATPRGGIHSADIGLLKRHGLLYTRDRSYVDYTKFVSPEITDEFADIPRFGYDETVFMRPRLIEMGLKTVMRNRFSQRLPDWTGQQIYLYLKNMLNFKMNMEQSYLVTNLHPFHIWNNRELATAFCEFLSYIDNMENISIITMKDFASGLIKEKIILEDRKYLNNNSGGRKSNDGININPLSIPDIAIVFNSSPQSYSGPLTVTIGSLQALMLFLSKNTRLFHFTCERYKQAIPFQLHRRQLTFNDDLPPYSSSLYSIKRTKNKQ